MCQASLEYKISSATCVHTSQRFVDLNFIAKPTLKGELLSFIHHLLRSSQFSWGAMQWLELMRWKNSTWTSPQMSLLIWALNATPYYDGDDEEYDHDDEDHHKHNGDGGDDVEPDLMSAPILSSHALPRQSFKDQPRVKINCILRHSKCQMRVENVEIWIFVMLHVHLEKATQHWISNYQISLTMAYTW